MSPAAGSPVNRYEHYHAHVYFDKDNVDEASTLCARAGARFGVRVGPHPCWSCQLAFSRADFEHLIPWLNENRNGMTVMVHALTGDNIADHTKHAYWLGDAEELNLSVF